MTSINQTVGDDYGSWGQTNITALPYGRDKATTSASRLKANPYEFQPCPNCGGDDTSSSTYVDDSSSASSAILSAVRRKLYGGWLPK